MNHDRYDDAYIAGILREARTFAFVGASANPNRPSHYVMRFMLEKGYEAIPVNPGLAGQEILGQRVYASLADIDRHVDVVDIFRNSEAALGVTREAIGLKERLGAKVVWMQVGVRNDAAAAGAEPVGLLVTLLMPQSGTMEEISRIADDLSAAAQLANVDILGGHTEVTDAVTRAVTSATVVARQARNAALRDQQ